MTSEERHFARDRTEGLPMGEYPAEINALFRTLRNQERESLLPYLNPAFEVMTPQQRREVLGEILNDLRSQIVPGELLIREILAFRDDP